MGVSQLLEFCRRNRCFHRYYHLHSLYSVAASSQFQNPISSLDSQCRRKATTTKAGRHSTRNNHTVLQAKAATALPKACSTACSLHHSKRKRRTEDASCRVWQ